MKIKHVRRKNRILFDVSNWGKSTTREQQESSVLHWIFRTFDMYELKGNLTNVDPDTIKLFEKDGKICAGLFDIS